MSTEQTPTTDLSDVEIIKRRDLVTFAVVALAHLTTIPLLKNPRPPTICKVTGDDSWQPKHSPEYWDEWKWWDEEEAEAKSHWEIGYLMFSDVS
jgi:hypothetical protein